MIVNMFVNELCDKTCPQKTSKYKLEVLQSHSIDKPMLQRGSSYLELATMLG